MKQTSTAGMKYPLPSPTCSARYSSTRPGSGLRSKRPLSAASSVGAWVLAAALRSEAVGLLGPVDSKQPPKRRLKKTVKRKGSSSRSDWLASSLLHGAGCACICTAAWGEVTRPCRVQVRSRHSSQPAVLGSQEGRYA